MVNSYENIFYSKLPLPEINLTKLYHILGSEPDLQTHVQNSGSLP